MWCVNNEMLCLPFMTFVRYACIYFMYCVVFGCKWVGVHVGRERKKGSGVGVGVMHNIY